MQNWTGISVNGGWSALTKPQTLQSRIIIDYTKSKRILSMVIHRQELIITSGEELSNAKRHNFYLWKDNYIRILLDGSCEFYGNMSFFEF
jgi:hypothetical protein